MAMLHAIQYCHMDDNIDDFRDQEAFQNLVAIEQFSNIMEGGAITPLETVDAIDDMITDAMDGDVED